MGKKDQPARSADRGVIELEDVRKECGRGSAARPVLEGIDLAISRGEHLAIVGPPGPGRSALFRILGVLEAPSSGRFRLEGYEVGGLSLRERARVRRKHIGLLLGDPGWTAWRGALGYVTSPMRFAGVPLGERRQRAARLLETVGLEGATLARPVDMTAVDKRRVAIARALANEPVLVLADEPTRGLSSGEASAIEATLESLNAKGVTIVEFTESLERGSRAGQVVELRSGKLVALDHSSA